MTEQRWTTDELDRIGEADELRIAPRRQDGTLRRAVPIWIVRVGDGLYVRAWRGDDGRWYAPPGPAAKDTSVSVALARTSPSCRR
jgi:hypothetical protein